jgi:tetratricopeptide (TPR) repeat protein
MNKRRTTFLLFLALILISWLLLYPTVDPFYLKALQDGKTAYHKGQYEQAINDLKIAEFGLLQEKEHLAQLYLYYSLSCYKLGRIKESRNILNTLKTELNINTLDTIPLSPQIENDVKLMLAVLKNYKNLSGRNGIRNLSLIKSFEIGFQSAREHLKNNNLTGVEKEIKALMRIDKKDSRILFLKGVVAFKKKKYKKCIGYLEKVTKSIDPALKDEVFFYLSLSFYFKNNTQQVDLYYQMIHDITLREKLDSIIQKNNKEPKKHTSPSPDLSPAHIPPKSGTKENSFDFIFQETLKEIKDNENKEVINKKVEQNLKKLSEINNKEVRLFYLKGLAAFKANKYQECIKTLNIAAKTIPSTFKNDIYYYLSLSNYIVKNYNQTLAFYQKIDNREDQKKLDFIIQKIKEERKLSTEQISQNFSLKSLEKLMRKFPGDQSLCTDILNSAIEKHKIKPDSINNLISLINQCLKKPEAYNAEFIQTAVSYLEKNRKIKSAIKVIEKSKFTKRLEPGHIDIYYKLGQLYFENRDLKKAMKQMKRVKSIQNDYKKVDYMILRIKYLIKNKTRRQP